METLRFQLPHLPELRLVLGWLSPPQGYVKMPTSRRGGWARTVAPRVRVFWYPGTDPAAQARKEAAAERRAARLLAKAAERARIDAAELVAFRARLRAEVEAGRAAHRALIERARRENAARVAAELASLVVTVTSPPPVLDLTADAVMLPPEIVDLTEFVTELPPEIPDLTAFLVEES